MKKAAHKINEITAAPIRIEPAAMARIAFSLMATIIARLGCIAQLCPLILSL
jgi:hypothetical protein